MRPVGPSDVVGVGQKNHNSLREFVTDLKTDVPPIGVTIIRILNTGFLPPSYLLSLSDRSGSFYTFVKGLLIWTLDTGTHLEERRENKTIRRRETHRERFERESFKYVK